MPQAAAAVAVVADALRRIRVRPSQAPARRAPPSLLLQVEQRSLQSTSRS
jgi:hypothetical protein